MVTKDQTVPLACVPCCAHLMVTTVVEYAIAKKDGRALSAIYRWPSVNFLAALIMDAALKVTATVNGAGKDYTANNRTASTRRALAMERVCQGSVIARLAGKEMIAALLISKYTNAFLRVPIMALTTWKQDHVYVTVTGPEWIVLKLYVVSIVVQTGYANQDVVDVTKDGREAYVIS